MMDGSVLPVRRSRCSLSIPTAFVADPVVIPKICVYDFGNGLHLYIFYRGHKMGRRKRPRFHVAEKHHLIHAGAERVLASSHDDEEEEEAPARPLLPLQERKEPVSQSLPQLLPGFSVPDHLRANLDNMRQARTAMRLSMPATSSEALRSDGLSAMQGYTSATQSHLGGRLSEDKLHNMAATLPAARQESHSTSADLVSTPMKQEKLDSERISVEPSEAAGEFPKTVVPIQAVFSGTDRYTYLLIRDFSPLFINFVQLWQSSEVTKCCMHRIACESSVPLFNVSFLQEVYRGYRPSHHVTEARLECVHIPLVDLWRPGAVDEIGGKQGGIRREALLARMPLRSRSLAQWRHSYLFGPAPKSPYANQTFRRGIISRDGTITSAPPLIPT
eukprot:284817742_4